jgi:regulator of cell morphogenesis and NO signaling
MSALTLNSAVGQWVAERPNTSRVFESLQIDYCCGGDTPLASACAARHLDPQQILMQLETVSHTTGTEPDDRWLDASLCMLCDHIQQTHHAYLRSELPRLSALIAKVVAAHGKHHVELAEVQQAFCALRAELEPHMFKEEQILFPAIRRLEQSTNAPFFPFGTVATPIRMMEHEHDHAGDALQHIRRATQDYRVPDDACNTYRAMLAGLETLEQDMHQHIHKENNILFPRAIKIEQSLTSS